MLKVSIQMGLTTTSFLTLFALFQTANSITYDTLFLRDTSVLQKSNSIKLYQPFLFYSIAWPQIV